MPVRQVGGTKASKVDADEVIACFVVAPISQLPISVQLGSTEFRRLQEAGKQQHGLVSSSVAAHATWMIGACTISFLTELPVTEQGVTVAGCASREAYV